MCAGFPTGLGSLVVRKSALPALNKLYWGGGSVSLASPFSDQRKWRNFESRPWAQFEDGTLNYLAIDALGTAIAKYGSQSPYPQIASHVHCLTQFTYRSLSEMCHANGSPVVQMYGNHAADDFTRQGGVVSFNLLQPSGKPVSPLAFDRVASLNNIHLRVGIFCNSGAAAHYLNLSSDDLCTLAELGYACGMSADFVDASCSRPCMAIRCSFGWYSTWEDAMALILLVRALFVDHEPASERLTYEDTDDALIVCLNDSALMRQEATRCMSPY
jgi:molybdenum cofactor sulfurtransferase